MSETEQSTSIKQKTMSGLFYKFSERILAQLVSFAVSIVLARILLPEQYGVIALILIFINICNVFVSSGFATALVQQKEVDHLDFSSVFYVSVALSCFLYAVLFIAAPFIESYFGYEHLSAAIRIMGLKLPISALNSVQHAYVSRRMKFKMFFYATLGGTIVSGVVGIAMAYAGYGVYALVAQYLTNTVIDTLLLAIIDKWYPKLEFSFIRVKKLLSYGWKLLASALIDTLYNHLRDFIIGKRYSTQDLGYYSKGNQFPALIINNITSSIDSVMLPVISRAQSDLTRVKQLTRRAIVTSSYVIMPCMMGLAVVAEPLISLLLTDKWLFCVPYLQIMCFSYAFYPLCTANLQAIKATGRSGVYLVLEIVKKITGVSILLIAVFALDSVLWIALSSILTSVLSIAINGFPNKKLIGYGIKEQLADILPYVGLCVLMGAPVYCINFLGLAPWLSLLIQVPLGIALYVGLSKLFKVKIFDYLLTIIKQYLNKLRNRKKAVEADGEQNEIDAPADESDKQAGDEQDVGAPESDFVKPDDETADLQATVSDEKTDEKTNEKNENKN